MKKHFFIIFLLVLALFISCNFDAFSPEDSSYDAAPGSGSSSSGGTPAAALYSREFWGEWSSMDQTEIWTITSTSVKINGYSSTSRSFTLSKLSDNVIRVDENGVTNCLYALRRASSTVSGDITDLNNEESGSRAFGGHLRVVAKNINDENDTTTVTADENGHFEIENLIIDEEYEIEVEDTSTSLNITPAFNNENIGTITLADGVNFKVSLSNETDIMYAGTSSYSMNIVIKNIGDTNCTAATYELTPDEGLEVINDYSEGKLLRTIASGETKTIPIRVNCSQIQDGSEIKTIRLTIKDVNGRIWNDSVSLKFYKGSATINVMAEGDRPISGVIIGDGRTFRITNRTNYTVSIPTSSEPYVMVFSGAVANASRNTECAYSVGVNSSAHTSAELKNIFDDDDVFDLISSYEENDDEAHAQTINVGQTIDSYLFENDVDYYKFTITTGSIRTTATPVITDYGVYYNNSSYHVVGISCSTSGASIYYTTDGATPTSSSSAYSSGSSYRTASGSYYTGILVPNGNTIKAFASCEGYVSSPVESYEVPNTRVDNPVITDYGVYYNNSSYHVVGISCSTSGASIYYTTNGATPTSTSNSYSSYYSSYRTASGSYYYGILVPTGSTVKAMAMRTGSISSDIVSLYVTSSAVATPVITDYGVYYDNSSYHVVGISCSTSGASIYYTTNGATPTSTSNSYSSYYSYRTASGSYYTGILVPTGSTVKAMAARSGYSNSSVASYNVSSSLSYTVSDVSGETYGFVRSTTSSINSSTYDYYYSENYHIDSSYAVMKITFNSSGSFRFYVRSDAEAGFDYLTVSNKNVSLSDVKNNLSSAINVSTKDSQSSGTNLSDYTQVDLSVSQGDYIYIVYRKDYSAHRSADRGYVVLPK